MFARDKLVISVVGDIDATSLGRALDHIFGALPAKAVLAPVADANGASLPVLTHRVEPAYPPDAKRTRRQGWVDVTFTVADPTLGANFTAPE